jgi:DNA-binding CsgD family transcriptional regulator
VIGERPWPNPAEGVGTVAMYLHGGRPDLGRALAERMVERARAEDSPGRHALALFARAAVHADVGALDDAEADLRGALSAGAGVLAPLPTGAGQLVHVLAERGAVGEAQAVLAGHGLEGALPEQMLLNPLLHARAVLRLAQGRWADDAADALELGRRHERWGTPSTACASARCPRRASPVAASPGRPQRDRHRLRRVQRPCDPQRGRREPGGPGLVALRAQRLGRQGPPVRARAAKARRGGSRAPGRGPSSARRCAGTAAGARPAGSSPRPWTRPRRVVRSGSRSARRASCGRRGRGPRRHARSGPDALMVSERRVAALAADGLTNRQVAQELFVTVATVETHLRRAYRQLGIEGRGELGAALDGTGGEPAAARGRRAGP